MIMGKQLVFDVFANKEVGRVPVGFWFHYTQNEILSAYEHPEMREQNLSGHKKFFEAFKPDFVKLMSDGYFFEPETAKVLQSASDLYKLEPITENNPWIKDQVSLVKELTGALKGEIAAFYNVFAPATALKWAVNHGSIPGGDKEVAAFIKEDKNAVIYALSVIGANTEILARKVISEGGADGIYLSVQSIQDISVGPDLYAEVISPSELAVLNAANSAKGKNILHICGYEGARNNLSVFKNYPAQSINFASAVEGVSLNTFNAPVNSFTSETWSFIQGLFSVIGSSLYRSLAGRTGVILGADCTVPKDIDFERFEWVREAAK